MRLNGKEKMRINNVIVIPAIAEYDNIKVLLKSLSKNDPVFFPIVFNFICYQ